MDAILTYWRGISQREQQMFVGVTVVVVIALFYVAVINPIKTRAEQAQQNVKIESELSAWVTQKSAELKSLRASSGSGAGRANMPLNQAVTSSISRYGLEIERLQPQQDTIQVWLKVMPFNTLTQWLEDLEKNFGVHVIFIEVSATDVTGVVEVRRLQLGRN
jgi:general secretion pathway protein M